MPALLASGAAGSCGRRGAGPWQGLVRRRQCPPLHLPLSPACSGDPAVIAETVKRSAVFSNLDNQVARLARKLPAGGDLAAMAAALGGGGGGAQLPLNEAGEEDLT